MSEHREQEATKAVSRKLQACRSKLVASFCLLLFAFPAFSQQKPFSSDQALFLEEMTAFMVAADKKEGKPFMEVVFAPVWNGSYYNALQRVRITEVANYMLKKRFEAFPSFRDYLAALAAFPTTGRSGAEFDAWMQGMDKLVQSGRKQYVADFITTCANLFKDNTLLKSPSTIWRSRSSAFTFTFDSIPKVVFTKTDLVCIAKGDSAVIFNTSGTYSPTSEIWKGIGGKVTWARAGLKPTATFAEWDHAYEIRMKSAAFDVDTVQFNDPYFERTLTGRVSDKLLANVDEDNASYPRFESYDRRMKIRDIVDGIDFEGGFTMQGAKLQGYGTKEEPAFLTFYRDKRPFIIASGTRFSIEPERITSDDVGVTVRMDKDSLTHPSTSLRFLREKRLLSLIKKDEGLGKAPFYNTYHQLDMYFEVLTWKQGDPLIHLGNLPGGSQNKASFESFDYFREKRYMGMLGIDHIHPLVRLNDYSKQAGSIFTALDFASYSRMQKQNVVPLLIDMANKGYLKYDPETEVVEVLPRLKQHILNSAGKLDYDAIQFNSSVDDEVNATLNLLNYDLAMRGVSVINMSDSQDVRIYPAEKTITIKKNRDFTFAGSVKAGRLQYYGKEYYFHYDPFTIDLLNVDSVSFMATSFSPNDQGETTLVRVKNVLEQVTGTLVIDAPSNKSGLQEERYPEYPIFNSTKESYVFYDRKAIQRGAYSRDKFYYRSDPFRIDSLDNFTNAGLFFSGTLVSAGIFPDIKEPLRLQPDYALGFVRSTGDVGFPLYGRKAKFTSDVTLNARGLQGNGKLEYLTSSLLSKQLIFTPDSTLGRADTLTNLAATAPSKVPHIEAGQVFVKLTPATDVLHAEELKKPMVMYDDQALLHGSTDLTPQGMTGAGLIDFRNATLKSKLFQFTTTQAHADTSDFRLTEGDTASIAFKTDNVNATVKLDERVGEFVSNGSETKVEFPVNQYICFMDRFKWFMDQGDIELESDRTAAEGSEDLQLSGSNFISIRPDQDSLSFMAPKARYDLKKHLITANDVQYIQVADALITPDSMRVRIRKNAVMDPLENTVITANFVSRFHRIYNATANIKAKRDYTANGTLDYVDENNRPLPINMFSIGVDTAYQTRAVGRIPQDQDFQLSPAFDFFGDVKLTASIKELTFEGSTRIQHGCEGLARNWMRFTGAIDPKEVFIPVGDTIYDDQGALIGAGIHLTDEDPFSTYGTFLSRTRSKDDRDVITAGGLLFYDKGRKEYVISNKDKIRQRNLPGNLVSLAVENCAVIADGRIDLGVNLGRVKLTEVGTMRYETAEKKTYGNGVLIADFHFFDNALERMASEILAYPEQTALDITKTYYEKMMREVLGLERSDKLISELSIKGEIKRLPDELVKPIVLGDVKLTWNGPEQSWLSDGPIGVATILKKPVYRMMKGKVHVERKRSGDIMTIYLALNDQTYWFFQYTRNYLYAYSSDQQFNTMLAELKDDKRQLTGGGKDLPDYQFMLTNKKKVDDFRERFGL
ncbi:MAG: hypothetical protein IPL52_00320 [Flavobacteriales bacterium]|nr:hypothetical protein [Flavobacteriales bacterium]